MRNNGMIVSVIGSGYVGLSTGVSLADPERGSHTVYLIDNNPSKTLMLQNGSLPIYEEGIEKYFRRNFHEGRLKISETYKPVRESDVIFICVGTPSNDDGSLDLSQVKAASEEIGRHISHNQKYHVIAVKSTVLPPSTKKHIIPILEEYSEKKVGEDFGVCVNPEFLREGKAVEDSFGPSRIIIGEYDKRSGDLLMELYRGWRDTVPRMRTDLTTAEMIKYTSNVLLALRISAINELGNIAKLLGLDSYEVMRGAGLDPRIGTQYLEPSRGWGGSCFPKDVQALIYLARELGYNPALLQAEFDFNERQKVRMVEQLQEKLGNLNGKTVTILGLSFKAGTDDIRYSPAIDMISRLLELGATVKAYDPIAERNMHQLFPDIEYCPDVETALQDSDGCLINTNLPKFKNLTDENFEKMRTRIIIEGLRALDTEKVTGFEGISW